MRESEIEAYLVKRVEALGGLVRKVRWIGRRGAPDRLVLLPAHRRFRPAIWVELKATGEKVKQAQKDEHEILRSLGHTVYVMDCKEDIDNVFAE